jgi:hypothetical protein
MRLQRARLCRPPAPQQDGNQDHLDERRGDDGATLLRARHE